MDELKIDIFRKSKIVVIDDEHDIRLVVEKRLTAEGFEVHQAEDGLVGLEVIKSVQPDLVILDILMPYLDGYEVCKQIRRNPQVHNIPVILLTARRMPEEEAKGLDMAANDYMPKPFEGEVLLRRVKTLLVNRMSQTKESEAILKVGPVYLEKTTGKVYVNGREVKLAAQDFKVLNCLMENPGQVHSWETLVERAWKYSDAKSTNVANHIGRIRQALGPEGDILQTHRGKGYMIQKTNGHSAGHAETSADEKRRILVIKGDEELRGMLRLRLETSGYEVFACADGREGLAWALRGKCQLILLDLHATFVSGEEILKAVRESSDPAVNAVPIFVLTGKSGDAGRAIARSLGADRAFSKPYNLREILQEVSKFTAPQSALNRKP